MYVALGVGGFIGAAVAVAFTCLTSCACPLLLPQDKLTLRWCRIQKESVDMKETQN